MIIGPNQTVDYNFSLVQKSLNRRNTVLAKKRPIIDIALIVRNIVIDQSLLISLEPHVSFINTMRSTNIGNLFAVMLRYQMIDRVIHAGIVVNAEGQERITPDAYMR